MPVKPKDRQHPLELHTGIKTFQIKLQSLEKDELHGCVEMHKGLITVDPNQSIEDYKGTLLHEICHVGFDIYGLGHDDQIPQMTNEYLTTMTSNMIQQLATLNPELFSYLLGGAHHRT
tara:strand:- start:14659 stop:15012 length:354 start_codon:yes stop_codon:yes gene_type:complete